MNPEQIELTNLNKSFEYIKFSNEIDLIEDINEIKNIAKCFYKMYLKQQEIVIDLGLNTVKEV